MAKARKKDQLSTLYRALDLVKDFSLAVDGGANVGDWLEVMHTRFSTVHAFEPNIRLIDRLREKYQSQSIVLHHAALWSHSCQVTLKDNPRAPGKDRAKFCSQSNTGDIAALSIDSLELPSCGLIKLDLEGAEVLALNGAKNTIKKFHPVLIVECKSSAVGAHRQEEPGMFLKKFGYFEAFRFGPDRVYTWEM